MVFKQQAQWDSLYEQKQAAKSLFFYYNSETNLKEIGSKLDIYFAWVFQEPLSDHLRHSSTYDATQCS